VTRKVQYIKRPDHVHKLLVYRSMTVQC